MNTGVVAVLDLVAQVGDGLVQSVVAVEPVNVPSVTIIQELTMVGSGQDLVCHQKIISISFS